MVRVRVRTRVTVRARVSSERQGVVRGSAVRVRVVRGRVRVVRGGGRRISGQGAGAAQRARHRGVEDETLRGGGPLPQPGDELRVLPVLEGELRAHR